MAEKKKQPERRPAAPGGSDVPPLTRNTGAPAAGPPSNKTSDDAPDGFFDELDDTLSNLFTDFEEQTTPATEKPTVSVASNKPPKTPPLTTPAPPDRKIPVVDSEPTAPTASENTLKAADLTSEDEAFLDSITASLTEKSPPEETEIEIPLDDDGLSFAETDSTQADEPNIPEPLFATSSDNPPTSEAPASIRRLGTQAAPEQAEDDSAAVPLSDPAKPAGTRRWQPKWLLAALGVTAAVVLVLLLIFTGSEEKRLPENQAAVSYKISRPPVHTPPPPPPAPAEPEVVRTAAAPPAAVLPADRKSPPDVTAEPAPKHETVMPGTAFVQTPVLKYPYSLIGGSYRSLASATDLVESYREKGLQAYWVKVNLGKKGIWYRVFIGGFPTTQNAAQTVAEHRLQDISIGKIKYACFIGSYRSVEELNDKRRLLAEKGYGYSTYFIEDTGPQFYLYVGTSYTLKGVRKTFTDLDTSGIRSEVVER